MAATSATTRSPGTGSGLRGPDPGLSFIEPASPFLSRARYARWPCDLRKFRAAAGPGRVDLQLSVHNVQSDVALGGVPEAVRHRGQHLEAERAPQRDGPGVGRYHRVKLHRRVAVCPGPVQDVPGQGAPDAAAAVLRADHEARVGNVRAAATLVPVHLRGAQDGAVRI